MPAAKYNAEVKKLYEFLSNNPMATYEEMEQLFAPKKLNANSLVKRLQRMGCVTIDREINPESGKIIGSRKNCIKTPSI